MNIRERFFTFNGLILWLFQFSLAQELSPRGALINVAQKCWDNSTVNLDYFTNGILKAQGYSPVDCEIILGKRPWNNIVISFYECDLDEYDELVFKDSEGTELSLTGQRHWSGGKAFIFQGPVKIHYATNATSIPEDTVKFKFVFTETHEFRCTIDEFECSNNQCIPKYLVCDSHNNCGDGSDEKDCNNICTAKEFKCANTKCISILKLCDTINDCGDNSDEKSCNFNCEALGKYRCNNYRCISKLYVCDDKDDCGDLSDETNCYFPCNGSKFLCKNRKCIDSWKVCDGRDDCGDKSDETNCRACSSYEFQCSNGKCVPEYSVCNHRDDCGDFSDEKDCNTVESDRDDQRKEISVGLRNPWLITIIVCAVVLAIVVITFAAIVIRNIKKKGKKPPTSQPSNVSTNNNSQNTQQPNLFGRVRQSFRLGRQSGPSSIQPPGHIQQPPTVPGAQAYQVHSMYPHLQSGVENSNVHQVSGRQSTPSPMQSPSHTEPSPVASGVQTYQVPSMYPHLQSGVDNPEFRIEE